MFHGRCRLARFAIPARYGMVWYGMCVAVYSFVSPAYLAHPISLTRKKSGVCNINDNRKTEKKETII